ncbi:hypothetical protein [Micromonospora andamanensis]|uniref:hypothetical protein n=1 Tax=Micromonospora andamanensis TaxID=1287068 RepID=UPI00194EC714|nr:hypothetical protein [Micromonospora andamanensis]GIJ36694.1 hypothetical protein Vwe01_00190 [Micromonospora andamanensis]
MDAPVTPDEETAPRRTPAQRIAAAAGDAWRGLVDVFGVFDWITVLGVAMLLAGLWVWFGTGPALAGVGALVVWMGIAGGRAAARAAAGDVDEDQAVEQSRGYVVGEAV